MGERKYNNGRKNSPALCHKVKAGQRNDTITGFGCDLICTTRTHGILYLARSTLVYGTAEN